MGTTADAAKRTTKPAGQARRNTVDKNQENEVKAMLFEVDGDTWRVMGVGTTRDDGKTLLHLASTTRFRKQKNGNYPVQITDWVDCAATSEA